MAVYTLEIQLQGIDDLSPMLQRAERDVGRVSRNVGRSLEGTQRDLRDVARTGERSFQRIGDSMANLGGRMRRLGDNLHPVGFALAGIGAAITGVIGVGVAKFASFEEAMARVRAISGATDEEFAALEAQARFVGETMGRFTAKEAAETLVFLSMAGLDARQSLDALVPTLKLSQAAGLEAAQAGDILTNIMTGMRLPVEDLTRVNDVLSATFTSANLDLRQLGESFAYVSGSASAAGLTLEETSAILGTFAGAGIRGSRAGTALEAMLRQMARITPQAQRELDRLGVSLTDARGDFLPMHEIVRQFEGALAGASEQQRLMTTSVIFGQAGARGMNALLAQGGDALEEYTRELENSEGTADRMAETMTDTLANSFRELTSALEGAVMSIGQVFVPMLRFLVDAVAKVVGIFNSMPGPLRAIASLMLGLVGIVAMGAGAVILLLGPLGFMLQGTATFIRYVPFVVAGLRSIILWVRTLTATLYGLRAALLTTGIGALVVGGGFLLDRWMRSSQGKAVDLEDLREGVVAPGQQGPTVNIYDPVVRDDSDLQRLAEMVAASTQRATAGAK